MLPESVVAAGAAKTVSGQTGGTGLPEEPGGGQRIQIVVPIVRDESTCTKNSWFYVAISQLNAK